MARHDGSFRNAGRYDSGYGARRRADRYGYDDLRGRPVPPGLYPGAFWGGMPMFGMGGLESSWGWPPYPPVTLARYGYDYPTPRRPPRESPSYGRGGDRAAREWAERYGYDIEYSIPPRSQRGGRGRR